MPSHIIRIDHKKKGLSNQVKATSYFDDIYSTF